MAGALGKLVKDRELRDKITTNCAYPIAAAVRHAIILGYQAGNAGAAATVEMLVLRSFERTLAEPSE